jgi:hypothetical protein
MYSLKKLVYKNLLVVIGDFFNFMIDVPMGRGTRWRSWLRHCATKRKVAGSISDGVIGIFH